MRRMSFALTEEQVLNQSKTVTRRLGWKNLKPGDLIQPVRKCMGLKKGEKQTLLGGPIKVVSVSFEPLSRITCDEIDKEGFPWMFVESFIQMFMKANKCDRKREITRIEFEYAAKYCNHNFPHHIVVTATAVNCETTVWVCSRCKKYLTEPKTDC